jgi:hypothetical protein
MKSPLPFAILLSVSPCVFALEVVQAEFGVFDASDPQRMVFSRTSVIPLREGQRYGWVIQLAGAKSSVSVYEEYLSPNQAGDDLQIPLEKRTLLGQRRLAPIDGQIFGEWTVSARDTSGTRTLEVFVEGQSAARFEFELQ